MAKVSLAASKKGNPTGKRRANSIPSNPENRNRVTTPVWAILRDHQESLFDVHALLECATVAFEQAERDGERIQRALKVAMDKLWATAHRLDDSQITEDADLFERKEAQEEAADLRSAT